MWEEVVDCSESESECECKGEARMLALDYVCNAGKYMNVRLLFKKCIFPGVDCVAVHSRSLSFNVECSNGHFKLTSLMAFSLYCLSVCRAPMDCG